jgi:anti-sigma factor RsiW
MNCEEFEAVGLGLSRERADWGGPEAIEYAAALAHANTCPRCAALQESWQDVQSELRELRAETEDLGAPMRVEMRLRQEFRTTHRTLRMRAAVVVAAWALAGAAVVISTVSWWNWHLAQSGTAVQSASHPAVKNDSSGDPAVAAAPANTASADNGLSDAADETTLIADNDADDFTLLPGSLPQETGDAAVVRVRLQRGALGALGLPVNEERAAEWIQVDLFVGQDGQPQAVRLLR